MVLTDDIGEKFQQKAKEESFQEWVDRLFEVQVIVREIAVGISSRIQETQKVWEETWRPVAVQLREFQSFMYESLGPFLQEIIKSFNELPQHAQRAVLILANHGWFFELDMTPQELWRLAEAFSNGEAEQAVVDLADYFGSRVVEIKDAVIEKFPNRKKCLNEAFSAHINGHYYLSIPVFLAQTDGICKEVIGQHLFIKKNKKPSTAVYVEQLTDDTLHAAFLAALAFPLPIGASEHEREEDFDELNRHMVLHGESTDYGTKVNSLKAISLLNYVAQNLTTTANGTDKKL